MSWVPLTVALAAYRVAKRSRDEFDLALKWPNDLVLRDRKQGPRKIGGILCEGVGSPSGTFVIAGIGVNCAIAPETDQPTAALGIAVDPFREALVREVAEIFAEPIGALKYEYAAASLLQAGDEIEWKDLHSGESDRGRFHGYGENGELLASVAGQVRKLYSEEIKLLPKR